MNNIKWVKLLAFAFCLVVAGAVLLKIQVTNPSPQPANVIETQDSASNITATVPSTPSVPAFTRDLQVGDTGSDVTDLQKFLESKNFLVMPPNTPYGKFGNLTKAAVTKWQTSQGLPSVGRFGPTTRDWVKKAIIARWKQEHPTTTPPPTTPPTTTPPPTTPTTPPPPDTTPIPTPAPTPSPTVSISASSTSITSGDSSTVTWSSTDATVCNVSNGWSGTRGTSGTEIVSPSSNRTYSISCTGNGGTSENKSVTVTVTAPPVVTPTPPTLPPAATATISASPTSITSGSSTTITWSSTNAINCNATGGWTGTKGTIGTQTFTLTANTTYSLSCAGPGGTSSTQNASVTVTAPPAPVVVPPPAPVPTATISASPTSITSGNSSTITWSSTNATSCTATGGWSGPKGTSGTTPVSPTANTTYSITCTGAGGTTSIQSTTVSVTAPTQTVSTGWTNEPTGMTQKGDFSFANLVSGGGWSTSGNASITSDTGAPISPSGVMQYTYSGNLAGGSPANVFTSFTSSQQVLYGGIEWKASSNWTASVNGVTKIMYSGIGPDGNDAFIYIKGTGPYTLGMQAEFPAGVSTSLGGSQNLTFGVWHKIEWLVDRPNSTITWWLDGVLDGRKTGITFPSGGINGFQLYGGYGINTIPTPQYTWYDHLHVSTK